MKKFFALVLAIMMVMSLAVPAAADDGFTLTLKAPVQGHTYGAYQIFRGDLHENVLSNVEWGSGIDETKESELLGKLAAMELVTYESNGTANAAAKIFASAESAADVAEIIANANWSHDDAGLKDVAVVFGQYLSTTVTTNSGTETPDTDGINYVYTISGLEAGYYLVKDVNVPEGDDDYNHFYTDYVLHIVKNVTVSAKGNVPIINKTVYNATHNQFMEYGDTYIGREITYRLEGSLPSYFAEYSTYWFQLQDTLSSGLDYVTNTDGSVKLSKVYLIREGTTGSVTVDITHLQGTITNGVMESGKMFEVSLSNDGKTMTVYFPELKGTTFTGKDANGADVEFTVRYSDKFVVEYTAKLNENAVIGNTGNPNTAQLIYNNDPNSKDGVGKTPPDQPKVYTYGVKLVKVDENNNEIKLSGAEFQMWLYVSGVKNFAMFDTNGKFTGWIAENDVDTEDEKKAITLTTGTDGTFTVSGLDVGAYRLTETKAPSGYNKLTSDVLIDIKAGYTNGTLTSLTVEANGETAGGDLNTGLVTITVKNQTGATLPTTGGMGTTLFYVIGSVMVLAAVVLLITKKRMTAEN